MAGARPEELAEKARDVGLQLFQFKTDRDLNAGQNGLSVLRGGLKFPTLHRPYAEKISAP